MSKKFQFPLLQRNIKNIEVICLDFPWLPPPLPLFIARISHLCYLTPFPPVSICIIPNLNELSSLLPLGREKRLIRRSIFSVMHTLCSVTLPLSLSLMLTSQTHPRKRTLAAERHTGRCLKPSLHKLCLKCSVMLPK